MREDAEPASVIGSAGVPDKGHFHYSISEGDGRGHFGIRGDSGDLYVRRPLDYEAATRYFLVVRAEAAGANASVLVSVTVEDVNDHAPRFPDELVLLGLGEDAAVGSLALAFQARDGDGTLANSAVLYSLTYDPNQAPRFPFQINPYTGTLTVTAPLDRESAPSFAFTVTATDRARRREERRRATAAVQVFLLDANDNRPAFTSASTVRVLEDAEAGTLLHRFVARDGDEGENGMVSYAILEGNRNGTFTLEEDTGETVQVLISAPGS